MAKQSKFLTVLFLGLTILVTTSIVVTVKHISPQMFQKKIHTIINKKTNQSFAIDGKAHWSFFPWLGFVVHDIHLTNNNLTYRFKLTAPSVEVHISPTSLLLGHVQIDTVRLIKPHATIKLLQPNMNHFPVFSAFSLFPREMAHQREFIKTKNIALSTGFNFDVIAGTLDAITSDQHAQLVDLNIHANHIHKTNPYTLSFQGAYLNLNGSKFKQPIHFSTLIQPGGDHFLFNNTHLLIDFTSPLKHTSIWQLNGDISVPNNLSNIEIDQFVAATSEFRTQGHIRINTANEQLTGQLNFPEFNCRALLSNFDVVVNSRSDQALTSCQGQLTLEPTSFNATGKVDQSTIQLNLQQIAPNQHLSSLTIDQLDLLAYAPKTQLNQPTGLNPLMLILDGFDSLTVDRLSLKKIIAQHNHCKKIRSNQYRCVAKDILNGQLYVSYTVLPSQTHGFDMQITGKDLDIEPLLKLLPKKSSFVAKGVLNTTAKLHYNPTYHSKQDKSLVYQGSVQLTQLQTQGFSIAQQLAQPNKNGFLTVNPAEIEHFNQVHFDFNGYDKHFYCNNMILDNNVFQSKGHGFIDFNSGVMSFEMFAHFKPTAKSFAYRILGTWPDTLKFISNSDLKPTVQAP